MHCPAQRLGCGPAQGFIRGREYYTRHVSLWPMSRGAICQERVRGAAVSEWIGLCHTFFPTRYRSCKNIDLCSRPQRGSARGLRTSYYRIKRIPLPRDAPLHRMGMATRSLSLSLSSASRYSIRRIRIRSISRRITGSTAPRTRRAAVMSDRRANFENKRSSKGSASPRRGARGATDRT